MSYDSLNIDEHVRLTQLQPEQASVLFALTDNNREYLGRFLPWVSLRKDC
jgi:ribosome-associated toxin RatA of RatAB toxin-antitoxin module